MRVLVATDGSPAAETGIELVAGIEWPAESSIRIIEAVDQGAWVFGGPWSPLDDAPMDRIDADLRDHVTDSAALARARLARPGLDVSADVVSGRPATAIVATARDWQADLIVVGSRGHGTIESMLLGSVSAEVIDHASAPVLVARDRTIHRIVLGWDGSDCSRRAAELLVQWPIFADTSISVVSVADTTVPWWTGFPEPGSPEMMPTYLEAADVARRSHDALAAEMSSELVAARLDAHAECREGDPAAGLIAAARACNADLIVVGTHGRTGLARLLLGSVARNVVHHASCSVLIVRTLNHA